MNLEQLGHAIFSLRKEANLTQKQLCKGICTQPTISMIEKGEILPAIDTIFFISLKLNKPLGYFFNILTTEGGDYDYISEIVVYIEELTTNQRYDVVYEVVIKELDNQSLDPWYRHFLKWQYFLSAYKLKKLNFNNTVAGFKGLLVNDYELILNKGFLKEKIYNTLAFLHASIKDFKSALFYYNKIDLSVSPISSPRHKKNIYQLRVFYNKAKTLYEMGEYEHSIKIIRKGIKESKELENMSLIGNFYYFLGLCFESTNESQTKISKCYKKAEFFFELLERNLYLDIIHKKKSRFLT